MTRKTKILIGILIVTGIMIYAYLLTIVDLVGEKIINDKNGLYAYTAFMAVLCAIGNIAVVFIVLFNNKGMRKVKSYASRSKIMIGIFGVPEDIFEGDAREDWEKMSYEAGKEDARRSARDKLIGSLVAFLIFVGVMIGIGIYLFAGIKKSSYTVPYIISSVFICTSTLLMVICDYLNVKNLADSFFDEEKINSLGGFDKNDDSFVVTEHKVYPMEVYIEISSNEKKTYIFLEKNYMYMLSLDRIQIKQRDSLNNDVEEKKEVKREFKALFKRSKKTQFKRKKKSMDELLDKIRTFIYE